MNALDRAISICVSQSELARRMGGAVTQQAISYWIKTGGVVPAEHCRAIEEATGGKVTRYQLRPDVFGPRAPAGNGK